VFGDHDGGEVCVRGRDLRHDRCIGDVEIVDSVDGATGVDNRTALGVEPDYDRPHDPQGTAGRRRSGTRDMGQSNTPAMCNPLVSS
jgi:hypothetical protein